MSNGKAMMIQFIVGLVKNLLSYKNELFTYHLIVIVKIKWSNKIFLIMQQNLT